MAETANIFVIDGEAAGTTPWEWTSLTEEGSNTFALDPNAKNNGVNGYKATLDGTNDLCYGEKSIAGTPSTIYIRGYFYFPSSNYPYSQAGTARYFNLCAIRSATQDLALLRITAGSSGITKTIFYYRTDTTLNQALSGSISTGAWHYIELYYKIHASSGEASLWIDGSLETAKTGLNTSSNTITNYRAGILYGQTPTDMDPNEYFYIDDVLANTTGPIGVHPIAAAMYCGPGQGALPPFWNHR